jgi:hypothetical protein
MKQRASSRTLLFVSLGVMAAAGGGYLAFAPRVVEAPLQVRTATESGERASTVAATSAENEGPRSSMAARQYSIGDGYFMSPRGEKFGLSPGEALDGGSPEEMAWMLRNGYVPYSFVQAKALAANDPLMELGEVNPLDGLDFDEVYALREASVDRDPRIAAYAQQLLMEGALMGSVGALDVLANSFAFGPSPDPVTSEAFTMAAYLRGNIHGGLGTGANASLELNPDQRAAALRMATQTIEHLNAERARRGLPSLQVDRRPGVAGVRSTLANGGG